MAEFAFELSTAGRHPAWRPGAPLDKWEQSFAVKLMAVSLRFRIVDALHPSPLMGEGLGGGAPVGDITITMRVPSGLTSISLFQNHKTRYPSSLRNRVRLASDSDEGSC